MGIEHFAFAPMKVQIDLSDYSYITDFASGKLSKSSWAKA